MGNRAILSGNATAEQLSNIYGISLETVYNNYLGVTPMLGQNDVPDEVTTFSDINEINE
jgi:hypothetical protein